MLTGARVVSNPLASRIGTSAAAETAGWLHGTLSQRGYIFYITSLRWVTEKQNGCTPCCFSRCVVVEKSRSCGSIIIAVEDLACFTVSAQSQWEQRGGSFRFSTTDAAISRHCGQCRVSTGAHYDVAKVTAFCACRVVIEKNCGAAAHWPAAGNTGWSTRSCWSTDNDILTTAAAAEKENCDNEESYIDLKTMVSRRKW